MGFNGSMEAYKLSKEFEQNKDSGKISSEESDKYEIEFEETLDNFFHMLLGQKLVNGVWVRDPYMKKMINKAGASIILQTIRGAVNKNMNFASYSEQEQREIESYLCEKLGVLVFENKEEYDIPYPANTYQDLIMEMTFSNLWILLSIARGGHMTIYRGEKTKTIINKQEANQPMGAY